MNNLSQILRLKEVQAVTQLSRGTLYGLMSKQSKYYDQAFPQPFKLGSGRAIGFLQSEVEEWIHLRASERNK